MQLDLEALRAFVHVAEVGGFTKAAAQLGVPKARLSQQVRRLEADLRGKLLYRTTRVVRVTPDGELFLARGRALLLEAEALGALFTGERALAGRVRIDLPVGLAGQAVVPRLAELLERYPGLEVQLSATDRLVDVVREGFDCVVRVAPLLDSNLMSIRLGDLTVVNCASPAYLAARGTPKTLKALDGHDVVHYSAGLGADAPEFEYYDGKRYRSRRMNARLTVNASEAFTAAARAGLGIIQVPHVGVAGLLERGELVEVLPQYRAEPLPVYLLHPHGRDAPPRIRVVLRWLEELLRAHLASVASGRPATKGLKRPRAGGRRTLGPG